MRTSDRVGFHVPRLPACLPILFSLCAILLGGAGMTLADDVGAEASEAVHRSVAERFPGYLIWTIKTIDAEGGKKHQITVFDSVSPSIQSAPSGESPWYPRTTYEIVVSESGKVISEEVHAIPEESVPPEALATFRAWRQNLPAGMLVAWGAYQEPNQERLYVANIIVNAIESHILVVDEGGVIVSGSESDIDSAD